MIDVFLAVFFFIFAIYSDSAKSAYEIVKEIEEDKEKRRGLYASLFKARFYVIIPTLGLLFGHYGQVFLIGYMTGFLASSGFEKIGFYLNKLETE